MDPARVDPTGGARLPDLRVGTIVPAATVSFSAFLMFGAHARPLAYLVLVAGLLAAWALDRPLAKDLLLIGIGITIVSSTSMAADVSWPRFVAIGTALALAVTTPFVIDRRVYRRRAIRFPWRTGRRWPTAERWYVVAVPVLGWAILPFYFITSGAYRNWPAITDGGELARFFVGVNAVGTWDELFFICTCFALLRRHFPVWLANLLQATIFVSFLWELGYREWGPLLTTPFALLQGWIFARTGSLTYVLVVHLLFDAIVFLAIVHAHHPELFPIFVY
ncbi:CPBP family intramembrane metalloprotease [Actinotalea sp. M2MS4P-6]|uniref:CPBP family intramembrane glutamic endopeptidase n=1 Tax=Actinotalea sp. M2MS4P-6 TaxID=2983762 RepID=UPI0021E3A24C|nr:CPBP family intramembrane glutamic endopeptidase [Actinotalea sp. M2MS4P-6]MCV2394762.1 CPBP family intramembrane metalloprotease [Actinotalea sp. M2MS4P-6]